MAEEYRINLNSCIHFHPTAQFFVALVKKRSSLSDPFFEQLLGKATRAYADETTMSMQLWEFMQIFGDSFGVGFKPIVKDNNIFMAAKDVQDANAN